MSTSQIANVKVQAVRLANFASSCSPWELLHVVAYVPTIVLLQHTRLSALNWEAV